MQSTALAPEDLARLRMAMPQNPMVITAALVLERPLRREALLHLIETRLLCHERFRRRVVDSRWASPKWADVAELDLHRHCVWHTARQPDTFALERFVEDRMNEPLDRSQPLWRLDVFEEIKGGAALVFRVHHVIADGEALVAILGGMADEGMGTDSVGSSARAKRAPGRLLRLLEGVIGAARLGLRAPDPPMSVHRGLGTIKRIAYSTPLSLADLLASAHGTKVTVTEKLLAAVGGVLRTRLASGDEARSLAAHALVPVSFHDATQGSVGNHFASVFVELPLGDVRLEERARAIACKFRVARSRGAVRASAHLVGAASAVGRAVERASVTYFSRRASVVVSSIRGPSDAVHLGGALVCDVIVWAPAPGAIPLAVTLMSYAGRVRIGVTADARVIGEPAPIVSALERQLGTPARRA